MQKISSHSHFVTQPSPEDATGFEGDRARKTSIKQPSMSATNESSKNAKQQKASGAKRNKNPLENDIYENVTIDLPSESEENDGLCNLGDSSGENDSNDKPKTGGSNIDDFASLIGNMKKNWLWAGGIALGIFVIGRATKNS